MKDEATKQEFNKRQLAIKIKNEEREKEMKECTFSPKMTISKEGKMLRERVGDRSTKS